MFSFGAFPTSGYETVTVGSAMFNRKKEKNNSNVFYIDESSCSLLECPSYGYRLTILTNKQYRH
jgi:hypothetical protein